MASREGDSCVCPSNFSAKEVLKVAQILKLKLSKKVFKEEIAGVDGPVMMISSTYTSKAKNKLPEP